MNSTDQIIARIDEVHTKNRRTEITFIVLAVVLFLTGIACFVVALATGHFAWSTPAAVTTALLYWPMCQIKEMREKNIALGVAPMLITELPADKAAEEIQKLLQTLFGGK